MSRLWEVDSKVGDRRESIRAVPKEKNVGVTFEKMYFKKIFNFYQVTYCSFDLLLYSVLDCPLIVIITVITLFSVRYVKNGKYEATGSLRSRNNGLVIWKFLYSRIYNLLFVSHSFSVCIELIFYFIGVVYFSKIVGNYLNLQILLFLNTVTIRELVTKGIGCWSIKNFIILRDMYEIWMHIYLWSLLNIITEQAVGYFFIPPLHERG